MANETVNMSYENPPTGEQAAGTHDDYIKARDFAKSLPMFTGTHDGVPFEVFENAIRENLYLIPSDAAARAVFVKQILTRVTGPAKISLFNTPITTVPDILEGLARHYRKDHDFHYYTSEIQHLCMFEDETLENFLRRLRLLVGYGVAAAVQELGEDNKASNEKTLNYYAIRRFKEYAPHNIQEHLHTKKITTVDKAVELLEKELNFISKPTHPTKYLQRGGYFPPTPYGAPGDTTTAYGNPAYGSPSYHPGAANHSYNRYPTQHQSRYPDYQQNRYPDRQRPYVPYQQYRNYYRHGSEEFPDTDYYPRPRTPVEEVRPIRPRYPAGPPSPSRPTVAPPAPPGNNGRQSNVMMNDYFQDPSYEHVQPATVLPVTTPASKDELENLRKSMEEMCAKLSRDLGSAIQDIKKEVSSTRQNSHHVSWSTDERGSRSNDRWNDRLRDRSRDREPSPRRYYDERRSDNGRSPRRDDLNGNNARRDGATASSSPQRHVLKAGDLHSSRRPSQ